MIGRRKTSGNPTRVHALDQLLVPAPAHPLTASTPWTAIRAPGGGSQVLQLSLHSPLGDISVSEEDEAIVALDWGWGRDQYATALLVRAREQLYAYFDRELTGFDLPLRPAGTPHQQRVWQALRAIPYGERRSYAEFARAIGSKPRAVGRANAANPIPIIIPCHRVVASDGLGGYSGGDGLSTKRALLDLESRVGTLL
jgi:methylated-DNA-[protein]-cysteine S-methyltransferase